MRTLDTPIVSLLPLRAQEGEQLARLSSEGELLDYELPDYRYYPTKIFSSGTRDWARVRFLQACERLKIPEDRWPKFKEVLTLPAKGTHPQKIPPFTAAPMDLLRDSPGEWRKKAEAGFRKHCDEFLKGIDKITEDLTATGILTKIEQPKNRASLNLRYEWAAKRYCYNEPYKKMATHEHSPDKIRKAVDAILSEAEIK